MVTDESSEAKQQAAATSGSYSSSDSRDSEFSPPEHPPGGDSRREFKKQHHPDCLLVNGALDYWTWSKRQWLIPRSMDNTSSSQECTVGSSYTADTSLPEPVSHSGISEEPGTSTEMDTWDVKLSTPTYSGSTNDSKTHLCRASVTKQGSHSSRGNVGQIPPDVQETTNACAPNSYPTHKQRPECPPDYRLGAIFLVILLPPFGLAALWCSLQVRPYYKEKRLREALIHSKRTFRLILSALIFFIVCVMLTFIVMFSIPYLYAIDGAEDTAHTEHATLAHDTATPFPEKVLIETEGNRANTTYSRRRPRQMNLLM